jgi:hypothetical protein
MEIQVRLLEDPIKPKPDDLLLGISTELFPVTGYSYLEGFAHCVITVRIH